MTPLEVWGRPVYGAGGDIDYGIAAFADTSERKAREKTIAGQAALLELAHDAIFVRDLDGRITYWNVGAADTYGFTGAEAVGRKAHDLLHTQFPGPLPGIEATAARDGRWDGELTNRCADGQSIIVESRWAAQRGPDSSLLGYMEINHDITARKSAEREALRRAHEVRALNATLEQRVRQRTVHLERANQNLAAFTSSAAHDLRTPLRALSGFAEVLVEEYGDRLEEKGRGYAGLIQEATAHMAALLDDLLHLSQVSRAEMKLQDVDLSAEVIAVCGQLRSRDPGRRVRVTIKDGIRAIADPALIRTVLVNLLENAWKFTAGREDASIEFATTAVDEAPLCCYVRDNGPASIRLTSASCSSHSSGCTAPASSPVPASAWPASSASSTGTAAGPGRKAPSAAAPPCTSPSTRRTLHEAQAREHVRSGGGATGTSRAR